MVFFSRIEVHTNNYILLYQIGAEILSNMETFYRRVSNYFAPSVFKEGCKIGVTWYPLLQIIPAIGSGIELLLIKLVETFCEFTRFET